MNEFKIQSLQSRHQTAIPPMNQYIQKYGQNAIQAYKKSLRLSQSLEKDVPSPVKQQSHLLPKRSLSKKSLKPKKNQSQSRLAHSKSIKNVSKVEDDQRKKGSSFIDGSKKVIISNPINGLGHTFSKLSSNPLNPQKKKLVITQSNTPKCSTPKMNMNLNLHQNKHMEHHQKPYTSSIPYEQKDKLTERIQRSSGKKNMDKCSTSQSKHQTKRSFLSGIESRLEDLLISTKSTLKSLSYGIRQCFDILLMNEDDIKLRKLFMLLKELFEKVSGLGEKYKLKFKKANEKIHSMEMIHQAYLANGETSQRAKGKFQTEALSSKVTKKQASIQAIIMNQNYELRKKLNKLEKQLEYYTSQSASLNNVFGKFKNSQSQLNISKGFNSQLQEDHVSSGQKNQMFSNSKLEKRRSSQNLLYKNEGNDNVFALGVEKRLSFDPGVLQAVSESKKKLFAQQQQLNSLYNSSMGSSQYSEGHYHEGIDYDPRRPHRQNRVEQLSEEEDSQNQE